MFIGWRIIQSQLESQYRAVVITKQQLLQFQGLKLKVSWQIMRKITDLVKTQVRSSVPNLEPVKFETQQVAGANSSKISET